jgi:hypothetical protein
MTCFLPVLPHVIHPTTYLVVGDVVFFNHFGGGGLSWLWAKGMEKERMANATYLLGSHREISSLRCECPATQNFEVQVG